MKAKLITHKRNMDGSMTLFFAKGLDRHILIDMEEKEVEISLPTPESETTLSEYQRGCYDTAQKIITMLDSQMYSQVGKTQPGALESEIGGSDDNQETSL